MHSGACDWNTLTGLQYWPQLLYPKSILHCYFYWDLSMLGGKKGESLCKGAVDEHYCHKMQRQENERALTLGKKKYSKFVTVARQLQ